MPVATFEESIEQRIKYLENVIRDIQNEIYIKKLNPKINIDKIIRDILKCSKLVSHGNEFYKEGFNQGILLAIQIIKDNTLEIPEEKDIISSYEEIFDILKAAKEKKITKMNDLYPADHDFITPAIIVDELRCIKTKINEIIDRFNK